MADNRIHYSGSINANIGRIIPPGGITTWNLGLRVNRQAPRLKLIVVMMGLIDRYNSLVLDYDGR